MPHILHSEPVNIIVVVAVSSSSISSSNLLLLTSMMHHRRHQPQQQQQQQHNHHHQSSPIKYTCFCPQHNKTYIFLIEPSLLLFADFAKAFDSIDRDFMLKCLKHLNFGVSITRWVNIFSIIKYSNFTYE